MVISAVRDRGPAAKPKTLWVNYSQRVYAWGGFYDTTKTLWTWLVKPWLSRFGLSLPNGSIHLPNSHTMVLLSATPTSTAIFWQTPIGGVFELYRIWTYPSDLQSACLPHTNNSYWQWESHSLWFHEGLVLPYDTLSRVCYPTFLTSVGGVLTLTPKRRVVNLYFLKKFLSSLTTDYILATLIV